MTTRTAILSYVGKEDASMATKARIGRPPRTDAPMPTTLLLSRALKVWLTAQAAREERSMGTLVEEGLRLYQAREIARRKRAGRRERGTR